MRRAMKAWGVRGRSAPWDVFELERGGLVPVHPNEFYLQNSTGDRAGSLGVAGCAGVGFSSGQCIAPMGGEPLEPARRRQSRRALPSRSMGPVGCSPYGVASAVTKLFAMGESSRGKRV